MEYIHPDAKGLENTPDILPDHLSGDFGGGASQAIYHPD
jgi:hypothetical protein